MKQALEALELYQSKSSVQMFDDAAKVLRQAIEQAEMIEKGTKAWADVPDATEWVDDLRGNVDAVNMNQEYVDETAKGEHEPVAWMYVNTDGECEQIEYGEPLDDPAVTPLYTAPPKRQWVGLTEQEMTSLRQKNMIDAMTRTVFDFEYIRAIEAKLKERNS